MHSFRLKYLLKLQPDIFDSTHESTNTFLEFSTKYSQDQEDNLSNLFTIVIGSNGVGKSRALGEIAEIFAKSYGELGPQARKTPYRPKLKAGWEIQYFIDDVPYNASTTSITNSPLPKRVIALATTATDKFPLTTSPLADSDTFEESRYSYIGFKDKFGRSTPTYAIQRALEALTFSDQSFDRKVKVSEIFRFLGYRPEIHHIYRWRISIERTGNSVQKLLEYEHDSPTVTKVQKNLRKVVAEDPSIEKRINATIKEFTRSNRSGRVYFHSDFGPRGKIAKDDLLNIQLLRKIGLLSFDSIELLRLNAVTPIDFRQISSGELSMLTSFLGISATIEDASLILIDEPEVSLHPEWQANYLTLLRDTFSDYSGCHFIIATHSPILLSNSSRENTNTVKIGNENHRALPEESYGGESTDEVLMKAFRVPGKNNLYLKQLTIEALRLIADGSIDSVRFAEISEEIRPIIDKLDANSSVYELLSNITSANASRYYK